MLLDSNIIIYLSKPEYSKIRNLLAEKVISTSIICKIETLGYPKLEPITRQFLENFFDSTLVTPLTDEICNPAIQLRQNRSISLADSIVAATALIEGVELATRNISDFKSIKGLSVFNPFKD